MFKIICVTNRNICKNDFLSQIEVVAKQKPARIILREKDLGEEEYEALAKKVLPVCQKYEVPCSLHNFEKVAEKLGHKQLHLPLPVLRQMDENKRKYYCELGASCHSVLDAIEAERLGCTYITAGHIYETDCKKGLPGRGLDFLQSVCEAVGIPVYALGGITPDNIACIKGTKAAGAAMMSYFMQTVEGDFIHEF